MACAQSAGQTGNLPVIGSPAFDYYLSLSSAGKVIYTLKTPYRDGSTQVAFEPVDFIARLAALVPEPRVNLTRYHGVLACAARLKPSLAGADYSCPPGQRCEPNHQY